MKTNKAERKLGKSLESLIGEMNRGYRMPSEGMSEEEEIDMKRKDIQLRDEMVSHDLELLRCRKLSERFLAEQRIDITYEVRAEVSSNAIVTKVSVLRAVKVA